MRFETWEICFFKEWQCRKQLEIKDLSHQETILKEKEGLPAKDKENIY